MQEQKFIPEGWNQDFLEITNENVNDLIKKQCVIQGIVKKYDSNYNLYVDLGKNYTGIIPNEEVEAFDINKRNIFNKKIFQSKVNKVVQFKVKEIQDNNTLILSRKQVEEEALYWVKNELEIGQVVKGIVQPLYK